MSKPKRLADRNKTKEEMAQDEKQLRRLGRVQFYLVLIGFIFIIFVTEGVSHFFGRTAGTVAMCVMAAIIAVLLYREEIVSFFKKNH